LGQRSGERLEHAELVASEEISVREATTFQTALEQFDDEFLMGKIRKCHCGFYSRIAGGKSLTNCGRTGQSLRWLLPGFLPDFFRMFSICGETHNLFFSGTGSGGEK